MSITPEYVHNPTYPCTCHIAHSAHVGRHAVTEEIIYCPMHRAAPALLAACEGLLQAAKNWACHQEIYGAGKNNPAAIAVRDAEAALAAAKGE